MSSAHPEASDVEQVIEQRIEALQDTPELKETVTIEHRGVSLRAIEVISMPLALLKYNPDTHRIRAQRTTDPEQDRELAANPYGEAAQKYLHYLLMGDPADPSNPDPNFLELKEDLREHGQAAPGIITRAGVLINGNTRAAALKELGRDSIRVGVLPRFTSQDEFEAVELALQLRKEHRRDYSFMNQLLAIDERRKKGWPTDKILSEFRIKPKTLEQNVWILEAIRDVIKRSQVETEDGAMHALRLIDFERHQGKLEELYRAYNAMRAKSPDGAEAMKEQRLMAIALDRSKTDVRLIGADFAKQYMPRLIPAAPAATARTIPGTNVAATPPAPEVASLRALTDSVLQARAIEAAGDGAPAGAVAEAGTRLAAVRDQLGQALTTADIRAKEQKRRAAAVDRLGDANEDLDLTIQAIAVARSTRTFDPEDLDEALLALRERLRRLARESIRGSDGTESGDGLQWLRALAAFEEIA